MFATANTEIAGCCIGSRRGTLRLAFLQAGTFDRLAFDNILFISSQYPSASYACGSMFFCLRIFHCCRSRGLYGLVDSRVFLFNVSFPQCCEVYQAARTQCCVWSLRHPPPLCASSLSLGDSNLDARHLPLRPPFAYSPGADTFQ